MLGVGTSCVVAGNRDKHPAHGTRYPIPFALLFFTGDVHLAKTTVNSWIFLARTTYRPYERTRWDVRHDAKTTVARGTARMRLRTTYRALSQLRLPCIPHTLLLRASF